MRVAPKFTPEVLIEAPRRGSAIPNRDGSQVLFTCSTHTIGAETLKEIKLLDTRTGASQLLTSSSQAHDPGWLNEASVAYLESAERGATQLKVTALRNGETSSTLAPRSTTVAVFPAPVSQLKLKTLHDGSVALAVVGRIDSDGNMFNEDMEDKKSSIRAYDNFNVRFWDKYLKLQKYTIWYGRLVQSPSPLETQSGAAWTLDGPLRNLLRRSPEIEAPEGMNDGFADALKSFDLAEKGIIFTAHDPSNSIPLYKDMTKVYYVYLESWSAGHLPASPKEIPVYQDTSRGIFANPRISPDGKMVAFLKSSVKRIQDARLYLAELEQNPNHNVQASAGGGMDVWSTVTGTVWDLVPSWFEFSVDGHSLFLAAQDHGQVALYRLDLQPNATPQLVLRQGSVASFRPLAGAQFGKLFVTTSSLVESSSYQVVDGSGQGDVQVVSSASHNGATLGLSPEQVTETYFQGAGDYLVQAWVVKPRDFNSARTYPLCLHVHGGPESAWNNAWSTRWNAAAWAEQGYIVVAPNITGSIGFGLEHTERIFGQWGNYPYKDLEKCVEHISNMPYIDLDNAVAAGGSYGGFMMLWLQGQPLARKFKALVCHDGIFHLPSFLLECDVTLSPEDFKGTPYIWNNMSELDKWNPARPDLLRKWKTPMLVIHSDLDYRVPVTEGISAFNTCQALGIPSRFVNFPDENHFVLKEENSLQWHREVFAWINRFSSANSS